MIGAFGIGRKLKACSKIIEREAKWPEEKKIEPWKNANRGRMFAVCFLLLGRSWIFEEGFCWFWMFYAINVGNF
jgi:hypothetical protein